jgi:hypothetical protein
MTSISSKLAVVAACAGTALMASVMNANSALAVQLNFTFTQEGFEGGGILTGSFTGEDQNAGEEAGTLDRDEITNFSLSFSESTNLSAFSFDINDLRTFSLCNLDLNSSCNLNSPTSMDLEFTTSETPVFLTG